MTAIQLEEVRLHYGNTAALDRVSLEVDAGELLPVLGPSGCGKTSLLRVLAGLAEPDGGRVRIGEQWVNDPRSRVPAHRRGVGMVFQQLALWPHLTVAGNLHFGLKARRLPRAERRRRVGEALELVGLGGFEPRLPGSLSGGERQRVALARALVGRPRLLLLDEPLSSVDAMLREELLAEVRHVNRRLGVTTLYVTHDKDEALALGRRIAVMDRGRIVQLDTPDRLHHEPANRFVATLMGAFNLFFATRDPGGRLVPLADADPRGAPPPGAVLAALRADELGLGTPEAEGLRGTVEVSMFDGGAWLVAVRAGRIDLKVAHDRALDPGAEVTVELRAKPRVLEGSDPQDSRRRESE